MAFGPRVCACCIEIFGVEAHHLYPRSQGCPDDLTVWLCHDCHGRVHGMNRRMNMKQLTIAGLAAAKAQGKKLGGLRAKGIEARDEAKARAETLRPILTELQGMSANAIAIELNARKVPTPTGKPWSAQTVIRVQKRLAAKGE